MAFENLETTASHAILSHDVDPRNPLNWPASVRWGQIILVASLTFVASLSSSMLAPAVPAIMQGLDSDDSSLETFVVSVYVIGSALGPLIIAPLSEIYGRAIIYNISNGLFLGSTIGCALSKSIVMLTVFRFFCGCAGVTPLALGGGTVSDVMPPETMGIAMAVWGLGSLVAPVVAPIGGGYLAEAAGWRWIFWLIAILSGATSLASLLCLRETYRPVILKRNNHLRQQMNCTSRPHSGSRATLKALTRPLRLLVTSPVIFALAFYVAVVYGIQYLIFTTLSYVFQDEYKFSTGQSGLTFLGNGIGCLLGVFGVGLCSDKLVSKRQKAGKDVKPEIWLWPTGPAAILIPSSVLWYGWSLHANVLPIVPLVSLGVFGFAIMAILQPVQTYVVNIFPSHASSALAATNILRSVVGAVLPLGGQKLYSQLGLGWGNSVLALVTLLLIPVPLLLIFYGTKLRPTCPNDQR